MTEETQYPAEPDPDLMQMDLGWHRDVLAYYVQVNADVQTEFIVERTTERFVPDRDYAVAELDIQRAAAKSIRMLPLDGFREHDDALQTIRSIMQAGFHKGIWDAYNYYVTGIDPTAD